MSTSSSLEEQQKATLLSLPPEVNELIFRKVSTSYQQHEPRLTAVAHRIRRSPCAYSNMQFTQGCRGRRTVQEYRGEVGQSRGSYCSISDRFPITEPRHEARPLFVNLG